MVYILQVSITDGGDKPPYILALFAILNIQLGGGL